MSESPNELKDMAGMRNRIKTAMKRKSCCDHLYIKIAVKKCIALIVDLPKVWEDDDIGGGVRVHVLVGEGHHQEEEMGD